MTVPALLRPRRRLFVLADSISLHYGPYLQEFLGTDWSVERKQGRVRTIDDGSGANGGNSAAVLEYLRRRRQTGGIPADVLLLNCGLHDLKRTPGGGAPQVSPDDYTRNLELALAEVRQLGLRPVWVRTTPVVDAVHNAVPRQKDFDRRHADVLAYNAVADGVMSRARIPSIDLFGFTLPLLPGATYDGVHFVEDVRRDQGAFLATELRRLDVTEALSAPPAPGG